MKGCVSKHREAVGMEKCELQSRLEDTFTSVQEEQWKVERRFWERFRTFDTKMNQPWSRITTITSNVDDNTFMLKVRLHGISRHD